MRGSLRGRSLLAALAAALCSLALAAPAMADFQVTSDTSGEPCSEVSAQGSSVTGGCLVEELTAILGNAQTVNGWSGCHFNLGQMRVAADGALYVSGTTGTSVGWCGVGPCPDAAGNQIPWAGQIRAVEGGRYVVDLDICFKFTLTGAQETETITTSLTGYDESPLTLSQEGYSEDGDLLHGGTWTTHLEDITIEAVEGE